MVSKLAKAIGFIGGVAAVVWAMRDRFISVAASREPELPSFREDSGGGSDRVDLESINGIGPGYANRLRAAGFASVGDLIDADPAAVAEAIGVGADRVQGWIDQART